MRVVTAAGQRHVVELFSSLAAVLPGPVEEVQDGAALIRLRLGLLQEDEGGGGDRPGLGTVGVGEGHTHALHAVPLGVGGGSGEGVTGRLQELARLILELGPGEVVLLRVGVFDVTDRVIQLTDVSGNTFVALAGLAATRPRRGLGGKGNEGVAAYVGQLNNSIGYVEYAYAKQNHLAWTQLQNKAGKFLQPSGDAFAAAASNAKWNSVKGMGVSLANTDGAKSWPITSATFVLLQQTQTKPDQGRAVLNFFDWSWKHGGKAAEKLDYVPLPRRCHDPHPRDLEVGPQGC